MPEDRLKDKLPLPVLVVGLFLAAQATVFYALPLGEHVPASRPLALVPHEISGWRMIEEGVTEKEILDVLKADDTLTRIYVNADGSRMAHLFVAFFKTQRAGATTHSPKVCLPGSGWLPESSGTLSLTIPGRSKPIEVNRYIVSKGDQKSLVLYWYQTPHRIIANEFAAKFYLMVDGVRYRRSDTAMIRVIVPVGNGREDQAEQTAIRFVQAIFNPLRAYLPA